MPRTRTVFKFIGLLIVLLVLAIGAGALYIIRSPFPQTSGVIEVDGLSAPVTVKRDALGVAHIYAENMDDLLFAQGYTHAQDRFWQMEFWRHIGTGRLSEIVGSATVDTDKFIRNIGWNRIALDATENYRQNSPEIYANLEAYSEGVNAWIDEHGDNISFNQTVLGLSAGEWEIEPWEPLHTVAWGVVMAWDLRGSSNINSEQTWATLESALGSDLLEQIMPRYPENRPIIVPSENGASWAAPSTYAMPTGLDMIGTAPPNGFALGFGDHVGSNNWVVAGEHTDSGEALLANDPHLGVQLPSIWYWNSLHAPGFNVAGMSFAGVPGVIAGHNDYIAWGVTNMGADSQDVYIEKLNPDNPLQYEFEGEWRDMTVIREEIKVNGGESIILEVHETQHGPLLNTLDDDLEQVLAARWTATEPSRIFQAVIELNHAKNYDDFRSALSKWDSSPQNVVYADVEGNIAYQSTGRYPVRRGWEGTQPVPGWTGEFEWDGFIPYDEMPSILNPAEGFIVTANNAIVDDAFPYYLSRNWASGDRAERITNLIEEAIAEGGVSAEMLQTIQGDNYDMLIDSFRPKFNQLSSADPAVSDALAQLKAWDGQLDEESVAASIFELFLWKVADAVLTDDVGDQSSAVISNNSRMRIFLHSVAENADSPFWDDQTTASVEDADTIILAALAEAVGYLQDNHGENSAEWQWGKLHHITFSSNPLGESGIGPLETIVNRGSFPNAGGGSIINASGFSWGDNFGVVRSNASMRMVIDLNNFDNSSAIHPTGQSGHPYHNNYDSMIDLWLKAEFHPFVFGEQAINDMTIETLTLEPR